MIDDRYMWIKRERKKKLTINFIEVVYASEKTHIFLCVYILEVFHMPKWYAHKYIIGAIVDCCIGSEMSCCRV